MLYDDILSEIGGWGRYQKTVCLVLAAATIPTGVFVMTPVFTTKTPIHRCRVPEIDNMVNNSENIYNTTGLEMYLPWDAANGRYEPCRRIDFNSSEGNSTTLVSCDYGYIYDRQPGEITATMEWDLVCDRSYIRPRITSIYMSGVLVGSLLLGLLGDRFGRRYVTLGSLCMQFVFKSLNIFNVSPAMYTTLMFFCGSTTMVYFLAAVILAAELVDAKRRALVGTMMMLGFAIGYAILPLCAYYIRNWKWLVCACGLCGFLYTPCWWLIPESPRWLITMGKYAEARILIRRMCKRNGKNIDVDAMFTNENLTAIAESIVTRKSSFSSSNGYFRKLDIPYLDLFIQPGIIAKTLCCCFSWFVMGLIYLTLNFNSGNLAGDAYINCLIMAAVEIPAYLSVYLLLRTKGRRPVFFAYLGFSAITYLIIPIISNVTTTGAIVCAMAGKFCISSAFSLIYIYTAELFPTEGRNQAMGLCAMCARWAGVIAPYIVYLGETRSSDIPYYVTGVFAIAACFTNLFLPETLGTTLPDTYEEAANLKGTFYSRHKRESSKHGTVQVLYDAHEPRANNSA